MDTDDPTTLQMKAALDSGWSPDAAHRTLDLILHASCATSMVEQGHGVTAAGHGAQELGGVLQLEARSVIHQGRGLFSASDDDRAVAKIEVDY